jgi:hypothetical protein
MATKSFLKNIVLKDERSIRNLARTLEQLQREKPKKIVVNRPYSYAPNAEVDAVFAKKKT